MNRAPLRAAPVRAVLVGKALALAVLALAVLVRAVLALVVLVPDVPAADAMAPGSSVTTVPRVERAERARHPGRRAAPGQRVLRGRSSPGRLGSPVGRGGVWKLAGLSAPGVARAHGLRGPRGLAGRNRLSEGRGLDGPKSLAGAMMLGIRESFGGVSGVSVLGGLTRSESPAGRIVVAGRAAAAGPAAAMAGLGVAGGLTGQNGPRGMDVPDRGANVACPRRETGSLGCGRPRISARTSSTRQRGQS